MNNSKRPISGVNWFDAVEFCNELSRANGLLAPYFYTLGEIERDEWGFVTKAKVTEAIGKGYRLPTEKEWEYACRAMSTSNFSFDSDESGLKDFTVYRQVEPQDGGTKPPNGWGLFDMHGNVLEWCRDKHDNDDGSRVLRGGSFFVSNP